MDRPLKGIRVVELGTHVAVPLATRVMADWGAEVIKVEPPQGEAYRTMGRMFQLPFEEDHNVIFQPMNGNKKSMCINLKEEEGLQALYNLLETADVFVTNTRPKALEKYGLNYENLSQRFPRLIFGHFSGFGEKGPDKDRPGFDAAAFWARGGTQIEWMVKESIPSKPFFGFGDSTVSSAFLSGLLGALYQREKTGKGEHVQISLFGTALWYNNAGVILGQPQFGHKYPKSRYQQPDPMFALYQTKDEDWMLIAETRWEKNIVEYLKLLNLEEYIGDDRFMSYSAAQKNVSEITHIFEEAFRKVSTKDVVDTMIRIDTVHEVIANPADLYQDKQAWANGYLREIEFPSGDKMVIPNSPVQFAGMEPAGFTIAPNLGADSNEILKSLGYDDSKIRALNESKAVVQR